MAWVLSASVTLFSAVPDTGSQGTAEATGTPVNQVAPAEPEVAPTSAGEPTEVAPSDRTRPEQPAPTDAGESSPDADRETARAEPNQEPEHPSERPEIETGEHLPSGDLVDPALPSQKTNSRRVRSEQNASGSRQTNNRALAPGTQQPARGAFERPRRTRANASDRRSSKSSSTNSVSKPRSATGSDFSEFQIITDRNIFNAGRSARQSRVREDNRKPAQIDSFTLVGTMSYENRIYAFFDGSSPDYKKVLEPGKKIARYTVKAISGNGAKLEADGETVDLQVGGQMRRGDEGWSMVASTALAPERDTSSASSSDAGSGDESDIIKKLMAQRERELQSSK